jgi:membrane peptidoglycan carboxypeptidase
MAEGGSTITQQLVRHSFLSSEKSWRRKTMEALIALRLERKFSKDQILEFYLNKVYFGRGLYGVEAASLGFFGKHASDLDVVEAALLAGSSRPRPRRRRRPIPRVPSRAATWCSQPCVTQARSTAPRMAQPCEFLYSSATRCLGARSTAGISRKRSGRSS